MLRLGGLVVLVVALCCLATADGFTMPRPVPGLAIPHDPAFTPARLRAIDPCGLIDTSMISPYGDGFPVSERLDQQDHGLCQEIIATQQHPLTGISLIFDLGPAPCFSDRRFAEEVIARIRDNPPQWVNSATSLATIDACGAVAAKIPRP